MGSNKELISGMLEGMDPRAYAEAINENASFIGEVSMYLDPKAIADSMTAGIDFAADVLKYIDPKAAAEVLNRNERILPRFAEHVNPNVFTRSSGVVFNKLRYATYRPPMFQKSDEEVEQEEPEQV